VTGNDAPVHDSFSFLFLFRAMPEGEKEKRRKIKIKRKEKEEGERVGRPSWNSVPSPRSLSNFQRFSLKMTRRRKKTFTSAPFQV
jgi:hypothetical protein